MFDTVHSVFGLNRCSNTGKGGLTCSWLGEGFDKHQTGRETCGLQFHLNMKTPSLSRFTYIFKLESSSKSHIFLVQ